MSGKFHVKPSLEASIEFWGVSDPRTVKSAEALKVRLIDVHPSKSLVLAADREGKVLLWDYNLKKTIISQTLISMILDRSNATESKSVSTNTFPRSNRCTGRSAARMAGVILRSPPSQSSIRFDPKPVISKSRTSSNFAPAVVNKIKLQIGQILQVCFADTAYMQNCAGLSPYLSKSFIPTCNSESLIAIVCDGLVLFFDYVTRQVTALSPNELGKANPCCIEFAYTSSCLVGCSDGIVRVWDWASSPGAGSQYLKAQSTASSVTAAPTAIGAVGLALQTHSKAEVVAIKAIPMKNPPPSTLEDGQHRMRFISVSADGQALIWEIPAKMPALPSSGELVVSPLLPLARIRDSLGVGITRQDLSFDPETNMLLVRIQEKKIRMWDMEDIHAVSTVAISGQQGHSQSAVPQTSSGKSAGGLRLGKRASLSVAAIIGGGASDPLATVLSLKAFGSVAPQKGQVASSYGRLASFGVLQHPGLTAGCYAVCAKTNTFAILQDRGSSGDDASSNESASVVGATGAEKPAPLVLLHEFSVRTLLERYIAEATAAPESPLYPTISETLRTEAVDTAVKVYAVLPFPARSQACAVLTSVGVLVISLGRRPSGPLFGAHHRWGSTKLICVNDAIVQKAQCTTASTGNTAEAVATEVSLEVVEDLGTVELGAAGQVRTSMGSGNGSWKKRPVSKRSFASGGLGSDTVRSSSRPVFHPSPSGDYCAVHWPESSVYVVLCMSLSAAAAEGGATTAGNSTVELDRGHCLEFGWVGLDDSFLIKSPVEISATGSAAPVKSRRGSVSNMLFGAHKEVHILSPSQLLLKRCVSVASGSPKVVDLALHIGSSGLKTAGQTPPIHPAVVSSVFGGPVLCINSLNVKESEAVLSAAAAAKRQTDAAMVGTSDPKRSGPSGMPPAVPTDSNSREHDDCKPRVIEDLETAVREIKSASPPAVKKQVSAFYTLVSSKWMRWRQAQDAAAANALAAKDKHKKSRAKGGAGVGGDSTVGVAEEGEEGDQSTAMHLVAMTAPAQHIESVRWDTEHQRCAVVVTGSSAINFLQLNTVASAEDHGGCAQLEMQVLLAVNLCAPTSSLVSPLCGLTWSAGMLFTTVEARPYVKAVSIADLSSAAAAGGSSAGSSVYVADVLSLPVGSSYLAWPAGVVDEGLLNSSTVLCNPVAHFEVLGVHSGAVFTSSRDGTVHCMPVSVNPVLGMACELTSAGMSTATAAEELAKMTVSQREAALTLLLHRGRGCWKGLTRDILHMHPAEHSVCYDEMQVRQLMV